MAERNITLYHGSYKTFNNFKDRFQENDAETGRLYYGKGFYFYTSRVPSLFSGDVIYKVKAHTTKILDLAAKTPLTRTQAYKLTKQIKHFLQHDHPELFNILKEHAKKYGKDITKIIDSYKNAPDEEKMFWRLYDLLIRHSPQTLKEFLQQLGYNGIRDERDQTVIYNIFTQKDINIIQRQKVKVPRHFPYETLTLFGEVIDNDAYEEEYRWWNDNLESKTHRRLYTKKKYIRRDKGGD